MIRNTGSGFVSHTEEREEVDWALATKFTRSYSNSRAKRVDRQPSEQKKWYEREEIASQYLYCIKDPPCQTCCRYNEKLLKTLMDPKGSSNFPTYKHNKITPPNTRSRISQGALDEETQKYYPNNLFFCGQSSDLPALTRPRRPVHPFYLDVQDSQAPRSRAPCCAHHVTRASEAAAAIPGGSVARSPLTDHECGVEAKNGNTTNSREFPPPPPSVTLIDDDEKKMQLLDRTKTDLTSTKLLPSRIPGGFSRSDAPLAIVKSTTSRLPRNTSRTLLRPIRSRPGLSQPTSPTKIQLISPGEGNWRKAEEKEFFCRRSATCKLCFTDRYQVGSGCEAKLKKTELPSSSVHIFSGAKPLAPLKTDYTSLPSLPRGSESKGCTESAHEQSLGRKRPVVSPRADNRILTLLERDPSGKLREPPPIRNPSRSPAKPPRLPPTRAQRSISASLRMPPSASGRPWASERLLGRKIVCKHSPCKSCNVSCFDKYYSPNRTHDFDTGYDRPCTLPDIFARRTNLNLGLSPRRHDFMRRFPSENVAPKRPSKWDSTSPQTSHGHKSASGKAKWKAEREIYSSPSVSKKRVLFGKAEWKDMLEKVLLAGR